MSLLERQSAISQQFPMPVDVTDESSSVVQVTAEAVSFVVASTNATDAGSAAGTTVYARLNFGGILDSMGNRIGSVNDSSFSWGTGTVFTTQRDLDWPKYEVSFNQGDTRANKLSKLTETWSNGEYAIDYARGIIIGKKATAGTSDTATYKYRASVSGVVTISGGGVTSPSKTDDSAFSIGSDTVSPIGAVADETSPDSVDEGDIGVVRMTLTRFLKTSLGDLISGEDQSNNVLQVVEKPLAVSTYTPDLDTSTAAEASSVTKASSGVLYGATFSNGNAAVRYFQFFNSTTVPADGTVPVITIQCPANSTVAAEWPEGRFFSTGIVWCNSSTQNTKTIGGADSLGDVNYK
jgi:hypothetical protein